MAESLREEAARRGVTVYRVRVERGARRGLTPSQAAGRPRRGQLSIREQLWGYTIARVPQPSRYRTWWVLVADPSQVAGVQDSDRAPGDIVGAIEEDPFDAEYDGEPVTVAAVTVAR